MPAPWRILFVVDKRQLWLVVLGEMYLEMLGMVLLVLTAFLFLRIDRLTVALHKYMTAVENSAVSVIITDNRGVIEYVNKGFSAQTGYAPGEAVNREPSMLKAGQTPAETYRELWSTVTAGGNWRGDLLNSRKDGTRYWAETDISPVLDRRGAVTNLVAVQNDVTEKRRLAEELARLAVTDPLTGLANRRRFMEVLRHEIERARRSGDAFALLMLDIDHFKRVNDTYGHNVGDRVIVAVAAATAVVLRKIDTAGRLGGEEFAVILPGADADAAVTVGERIREAIEVLEIADDNGTAFGVTVSVGVTGHGGEDIDAEELLRRVDEALYSSKNGGRNRVTSYEKSLNP